MEPDLTERFDLSASACTVSGNPVEVVEGQCLGLGGDVLPVPGGYFLEGDWIGSGTGEVIGSPYHAAPDSLHLLWFSYAEDRFYQGDFRLPQHKIYGLLKAGYWNDDSDKQETYGDITICVLPGGGVVVWLSGGNKVFLGRYQGHAVAHDFASFKPRANRARMAQEERANLPAAVQEQLRTGTFGPRQWDTYLVKYPWKIEVLAQTGLSDQSGTEPLPLTGHYMRYLSAEDDSYAEANTEQAKETYLNLVRQPTPKAVPKYCGLSVQNKYGEKHEIRIDPFDEAETLAAFQALHKRHPQEPIVLRVLVDKRVTKVALSVSNGFQTIPLDKATVKHFEEN